MRHNESINFHLQQWRIRRREVSLEEVVVGLVTDIYERVRREGDHEVRQCTHTCPHHPLLFMTLLTDNSCHRKPHCCYGYETWRHLWRKEEGEESDWGGIVMSFLTNLTIGRKRKKWLGEAYQRRWNVVVQGESQGTAEGKTNRKKFDAKGVW